MDFCVWHKIRIQYHSFAYGYSVFPSVLLKRLPFPYSVFLTLLSKFSWSFMCESVPGICSLFHWSVCVSYTSTKVVLVLPWLCKVFWNLEYDASNFVLSQYCFGCQDHLWFNMNFREFFSISIKNTIGILIKISLNLWISLGNMDNNSILVYYHVDPFIFICFNFLHQWFVVFSVQLFYFHGFTLFGATVTVTAFLIYVLDNSLLVFGNAIELS